MGPSWPSIHTHIYIYNYIHPPIPQTLTHYLFPLSPITTTTSFFLLLSSSSTSSMAAVVSDPGFHVLAVDDSIVDRKLIERLLKTSSYQVTVVDSGIKALEFLGLAENENETVTSNNNNNHHEVEVNMIITDYSMPGMTGYDLLRKVKGSSYLKDIPVVIMSSENVPSRINRCLEQGADDFFLKPVKQSDVNKLIPRSLSGKVMKDQQQISCTGKRKNSEDCLSPNRLRTRCN